MDFIKTESLGWWGRVIEAVKGRNIGLNVDVADISRAPKNGMDGRYIEKVINGDNKPKIPTIINRVPEITKVPVLSFFGGVYGGGGWVGGGGG